MSSDDDLDISEDRSTDGSDNGSDLEGFVTDAEQEVMTDDSSGGEVDTSLILTGKRKRTTRGLILPDESSDSDDSDYVE